MRRDPASPPARLRAALAPALLALLALLPPARAAGALFRVPAPAVRTLPNGLKVMVFPDPRLPLIQVQLRLPAGVDGEPADQNGVAHVTAQLLSQGTTSRDAEAFARELGQIGAVLIANAGREYATLACAVLARDFESGIELMADAVVNPLLPEKEFRGVVSQAALNVIQLHQNPVPTADERLWVLAFPGTSAAGPPLGKLESLGRLTRDQVRAFYRERYRPEGAALAVAGDVTPERAYAAAEEWFGRWSAKTASAPAARGASGPSGQPAEAGRAARVQIVDRPTAAGCLIEIGLRVPGRAAPDELARSVAVRLFDAGLAERMARVGALGHDARSSLSLLCDVGLWTLQATAPAESAAVLTRRLTAELRRFLAAPPDSKEVAAARHRLLRGFPLAFETASALMSQWMLVDFCGLPADYFDRYRARVAALEPADLHGAVRRDADPERLAIVAVGSAKLLEPALKRLGPVEVVRLDESLEPAAGPADLTPPPTVEQEARGRKLLAEAVAAHGGLARLKGVIASRVDASVKLFIGGGEFSGTITQVRKDPYKMVLWNRIEGLDTRQVLNGKRAWTVYAPGDSVRQADSLEVAALRSGFASDPPHLLLAVTDTNARVAARGRERIGVVSAEKVEVVTPAGEWRVLWLDAATHRLVALDQRERVRGVTLQARRMYRDYREVNGIAWPFEEEQLISGERLMQMNVNELQLDPVISDLDFEPPAKRSAPGR